MSPANSRQHAQARDHRASVEAAIFEATERFLGEHAFRELTVEGVIAPTGMGRTAFYRYFPDLETVVLRRLALIDDDLQDATDAWLDPGDEDPESGLERAALELAQVYRQHAAWLRAFAEAAAGGADVEEAWRQLIGGFIDRATERIEALVDAGRAQVDHVDEVAQALVWMTERYLLETYGHGRDVPLDLAAATLAQVWRRTLFSTVEVAR